MSTVKYLVGSSVANTVIYTCPAATMTKVIWTSAGSPANVGLEARQANNALYAIPQAQTTPARTYIVSQGLDLGCSLHNSASTRGLLRNFAILSPGDTLRTVTYGTCGYSVVIFENSATSA